ncbi:hypothetical protein KG892_01205 [Vermiphilus pyriformis]|nr:MAG: hypothetical protein KG892_01205 [Vermiphilus pyriformis]
MRKLTILLSIITLYQSLWTQEKERTPNSWYKNLLIGALTGGAEVSVNQPLVRIKIMLQQGLPINRETLNLSTLYRGYGVNVGSMIPITAVQMGVNSGLSNWYYTDHTATSASQVGIAFIAGATSALVSSPAENIMTKQQGTKENIISTIHSVVKTKGAKNLIRGLVPTMARDGGFVVAYLPLKDIIKQYALPELHNNTWEKIADIGCGVTAGVIGAIATHPADTIKTVMQSYDKNMKKAFEDIYKTQGLSGLYNGLSARGLRVILAVPLMNQVASYLNRKLSE